MKLPFRVGRWSRSPERVALGFAVGAFLFLLPGPGLVVLEVPSTPYTRPLLALFGAAVMLDALVRTVLLEHPSRKLSFILAFFEALLGVVLWTAYLRDPPTGMAVAASALLFSVEALVDAAAGRQLGRRRPRAFASQGVLSADLPEFGHWHPVAQIDALREGPLGVQVAGHRLVVFEEAPGQVAALDDRCPHRGMALSQGCIRDGRVQCAYHGWQFDADGAGHCPSQPTMKPRTRAWEARIDRGLVWVRSQGSTSTFPSFDTEGYRFAGTLEYLAPAPLELVLDNFAEIEHHGHVHGLFGYGPDASVDMHPRVELEERTVAVFNEGPQKPVPLWARWVFGVSGRDRFENDWVLHFSPVHGIYEQRWRNHSGSRVGDETRYGVFFTPTSASETQIFVLVFIRSPSRFDNPWLRPFVRLTLLGMVDHEIRRDLRALEGIVAPERGLEGQQLDRFDRPLREARARVKSIYRAGS